MYLNESLLASGVPWILNGWGLFPGWSSGLWEFKYGIWGLSVWWLVSGEIDNKEYKKSHCSVFIQRKKRREWGGWWRRYHISSGVEWSILVMGHWWLEEWWKGRKREAEKVRKNSGFKNFQKVSKVNTSIQNLLLCPTQKHRAQQAHHPSFFVHLFFSLGVLWGKGLLSDCRLSI